MKTFRSKNPQKTYSGPAKEKYTDYHSELREDFNRRCAYTDCSDSWWQDGFHIDHFIPKKPKVADPQKKAKFLEFEHEYDNLVYACPQVNRAKGNDWPSDDPSISQLGDKGYISPRGDFNEYFERTDSGGIIPKDHPIAKYMWVTLKLYLIRYELYWRLEQLAFRSEELARLSVKLSLPDELRLLVADQISELLAEHTKYKEYLDINYRELIR
jgi:5-methylcytosine-specific restriction endonuclease McrA